MGTIPSNDERHDEHPGHVEATATSGVSPGASVRNYYALVDGPLDGARSAFSRMRLKAVIPFIAPDGLHRYVLQPNAVVTPSSEQPAGGTVNFEVTFVYVHEDREEAVARRAANAEQAVYRARALKGWETRRARVTAATAQQKAVQS